MNIIMCLIEQLKKEKHIHYLLMNIHLVIIHIVFIFIMAIRELTIKMMLRLENTQVSIIDVDGKIKCQSLFASKLSMTIGQINAGFHFVFVNKDNIINKRGNTCGVIHLRQFNGI